MTKRLGRGLGEIIATPSQGTDSFVSLKIEQIRESRVQPRTTLKAQALEELKASIKRQGVIEPVIVRPVAHGTYELVAGERRWRAAQALGITTIPAVIKALSDKEALEHSLIENIQRENLNPLEEAGGYARLVEEFGYTQEDISAATGRDRATVSNIMRMLKLPETIQQALRDESITMGHAKVLLGVEGAANQLVLCQQVIARNLSVRQLEALASQSPTGKRRRVRRLDPEAKRLEDTLRKSLGTKVMVVTRKKPGGRIIIDYFSSEDLTRILQLLGISA